MLKLRAKFQVALCIIIQRARLTTSRHLRVRPRAPSNLLPTTSPKRQTPLPGTPHLSRNCPRPTCSHPGSAASVSAFETSCTSVPLTVHVDRPISSSAMACLSPLALLLAVWTGALGLVLFLANVCSRLSCRRAVGCESL